MNGPMPDLLARRAQLTPDAPALEELASDQRVTYAEIDGLAAASAALMAELGLGNGDRVALLCRNRIAFFEILFGCAKIGAILVPLNWRMPAAELAQLVEDCAPKVLIHGCEDRATVGALCETVKVLPLLIDLDEEGSGGYVARRNAAPPKTFRERWDPDEIWYLLYTSGTTGRPKGVIQTYGMALANYLNTSQAIDLRAGETTLNFLPLFHTAGINLHTLPTLLAGGAALIMPEFDAGDVLELIDGARLDTFFGVPTIYQLLAAHPRFDGTNLDTVRHYGCGGAALSDALAMLFLQRGIAVCNGMGMTETGPTVFMMDQASVPDRIGSVGKPQLLAEVRIVRPDGGIAEPGETGELLFAGPAITPGYWDQPEAAARAFTQDGWLHSGDLGHQDESGYFYISGRAKEMFISGGENVFPAEIENVLASHPRIVEAAVIGDADSKWGEVGRAFLIPEGESHAPADDEIEQFCRDRLAAYKVPKSFLWVDDFPRTPTGKVRKHLLQKAPEAP